MLYSIKGKVAGIEKRSVIIETENLGYEVYVSKPSEFIMGEYVFLYLHHVIKQDDEYLVGFVNLEDKEGFKLLLNVQGIGPKSAMSILSSVNLNELLSAISNNDLDFIKSIPGVSERTASQILLDLNQYIIKNNKENSEQYKEIKDILKGLNYKVKDIEKVLCKIYIPNGNRDDIVREALRRLSPNV